MQVGVVRISRSYCGQRKRLILGHLRPTADTPSRYICTGQTQQHYDLFCVKREPERGQRRQLHIFKSVTAWFPAGWGSWGRQYRPLRQLSSCPVDPFLELPKFLV